MSDLNFDLFLRGPSNGPWIEDVRLHPKRSYKFHHNGLECEVKRMGDYNWNGYVTVPSTHQAYNKNYSELYNVDVHGGITYGETNLETKTTTFGFDTNHSSDISCFDIMIGRTQSRLGSSYKNYDFVEQEVKRFAENLVEYDKVDRTHETF